MLAGPGGKTVLEVGCGEGKLATQLILELCGGEASEVRIAGEAPAPPAAMPFDRSYVKKLAGLDLPEMCVLAYPELQGSLSDVSVMASPPPSPMGSTVPSTVPLQE